MARVCSVCGKGVQFGHKVSHANNKTNRMWRPNLQKVRVNLGGGRRRVYVCTSCLSAGRVQKVA